MIRFLPFLLLIACVRPTASGGADEADALRARVAQLEEQLAAAEAPAPLPASFAGLYPPQSSDPQLLFGMYDMSDHMVAIGLALQQGDGEAAMKEYEGLRDAFVHIGEIVPEWSSFFVEERVSPIGEALQAGDPEAVGAAFGGLGQLCSGCHESTMVRTHHAYHWGDYRNLDVALPDGSQISWHDMMYLIDGNLVGITWHAEAGRPDEAAASVDQLKANMQALGTACASCHTTERHYYVNEEILATLDPIKALTSDPEQTRAAALEFRRATCEKCHHVHIPAHFGHLAAEQ